MEGGTGSYSPPVSPPVSSSPAIWLATAASGPHGPVLDEGDDRGRRLSLDCHSRATLCRLHDRPGAGQCSSGHRPPSAAFSGNWSVESCGERQSRHSANWASTASKRAVKDRPPFWWSPPCRGGQAVDEANEMTILETWPLVASRPPGASRRSSSRQAWLRLGIGDVARTAGPSWLDPMYLRALQV
jgi:hypothetical protein